MNETKYVAVFVLLQLSLYFFTIWNFEMDDAQKNTRM